MRDFGERRRLDAAAAYLATCENDRIATAAACCLSVMSAAFMVGRGVEPEEANVASYSSSVNRVSPPSSVFVFIVFVFIVMVVISVCLFAVAVIRLKLVKVFQFFP